MVTTRTRGKKPKKSLAEDDLHEPLSKDEEADPAFEPDNAHDEDVKMGGAAGNGNKSRVAIKHSRIQGRLAMVQEFSIGQ